MEMLTPAFSKTLPSWRTQDIPPPPLGRVHVSAWKALPSIRLSSSVIFFWCSLINFSIRRRIGESSVMGAFSLSALSISAIEGASVWVAFSVA